MSKVCHVVHDVTLIGADDFCNHLHTDTCWVCQLSSVLCCLMPCHATPCNLQDAKITRIGHHPDKWTEPHQALCCSAGSVQSCSVCRAGLQPAALGHCLLRVQAAGAQPAAERALTTAFCCPSPEAPVRGTQLFLRYPAYRASRVIADDTPVRQ